MDYCDGQEREIRKNKPFARGLNSLYSILFSAENFLEIYTVKKSENCCFSAAAVDLNCGSQRNWKHNHKALWYSFNSVEGEYKNECQI